MPELTCTHGMPSPRSCVDCMEEGPVAPPATWSRVGAPFTAQFPGSCPGCDHSIDGGERVQRWDRETRTIYTHERCRP